MKTPKIIISFLENLNTVGGSLNSDNINIPTTLNTPKIEKTNRNKKILSSPNIFNFF
jgi:hypothetical protein